MRAYQFTPEGNAFGLKIMEGPNSPPGPGQVRVRVHASSLNYRDLIHLKKLAGRDVSGIVPLSDGAGVVEEVGAGVTRWQKGDRVAGTFFQKWIAGRFDMAYHKADLGGTLNGMLAEEVILSEEGLVRIPEEYSFEEAACLPCAGLTAWYSMTTRGQFQKWESLLALGTGGVSIFALQFALALGGTVLITSSSDEKLARAQKLGAGLAVNYKKTPEWGKEVWKLTNKRGVDHIMEVGGAGTLEQSLQSVAAGGHIALIGVLTGFAPAPVSLFPAVGRNVRLNGIYVGHREAFEALVAFVNEKNIHPVIDRIFPFDQAREAFHYLETGSHFGKVVIRHH